jgi:hypothetical protein
MNGSAEVGTNHPGVAASGSDLAGSRVAGVQLSRRSRRITRAREREDSPPPFTRSALRASMNLGEVGALRDGWGHQNCIL